MRYFNARQMAAKTGVTAVAFLLLVVVAMSSSLANHEDFNTGVSYSIGVFKGDWGPLERCSGLKTMHQVAKAGLVIGCVSLVIGAAMNLIGYYWSTNKWVYAGMCFESVQIIGTGMFAISTFLLLYKSFNCPSPFSPGKDLRLADEFSTGYGPFLSVTAVGFVISNKVVGHVVGGGGGSGVMFRPSQNQCGGGGDAGAERPFLQIQ